MAGVQAGGDRQQLHEQIRQHSWAAVDAVKAGQPNDLIARIKSDQHFVAVDVDALFAEGNFVGRAPQQVDEFLSAVVDPIRKRYPPATSNAEIRV
jgi:adenylosuccinate lyase